MRQSHGESLGIVLQSGIELCDRYAVSDGFHLTDCPRIGVIEGHRHGVENNALVL